MIRRSVFLALPVLALALSALLAGAGAAPAATGPSRGQQLERSIQALQRLSTSTAGTASLASLPNPPKGKVTVAFRYVYQGPPLPGAGIVPSRTVALTDGLWAMASVPKGKAVPVGKPYKDAVLFIRPGQQVHVELLYKNPRAYAKTFAALAWSAQPLSVKLYTYPSCFCLSLPYTAPAHGAWYRTIYLALDKKLKPGTKMAITWIVVTDPSQYSLLPGEQRPTH